MHQKDIEEKDPFGQNRRADEAEDDDDDDDEKSFLKAKESYCPPSLNKILTDSIANFAKFQKKGIIFCTKSCNQQQ